MTVAEPDLEKLPNLVIVTGMSGAGRTEAMHVFEDLGYFCVDNLPPVLIEDLVRIFTDGTNVYQNEENPGSFSTAKHAPSSDREENRRFGGKRRHLAVVCDARNGLCFDSLSKVLSNLQLKGIAYQVLFLDAADEKLLARYKSSRRRHPLCTDGTTIVQGIQRERQLLLPLRDRADIVIDTTDMLPLKLRSTLRNRFSSEHLRRGLAVTVYSFGFKHGAALDADVVIDVRFLPNPYYDPDLRPLTGLDSAVKDFVLLREETVEFNQKWQALLDVLMPGYVAEGKQQLAIALGCTGGQHRSVALAESTGDYLKSKGYRVSVAHRDLKLAEQMKETIEYDNEFSYEVADFDLLHDRDSLTGKEV